LDVFFDGLDDDVGIILAGGDEVAGEGEGLEEAGSLGALFGGEVGVARTQGQAVGFADGVDGSDLDGEIEVGDHAADDGELLGVFAAEVGDVGLDDVEKFADDGADPAKEAGAGSTAEMIAEFVGVDPGEVLLRVHFDGVGCENQIDAEFFAGGGIGIEGAGVAVAVFVGSELGGIDEDGDDGVVALGAAGADEGEVAIVEGTHGGDQADGFAGGAGAGDVFAGFGDGFCDNHVCFS